MIIQSAFTVAAPPDDVYKLMLDVEKVAPCIPGARVTGRREDGAYDAEVKVKLGPVSMTYRGTVAVQEHDDAERSARLRAKANEARGQGTAQATMLMGVAAADDGTSSVSVSTDLLVSGRVAQMGQGIMQDVATRMIGEMAKNMEAMLTTGAAPAAADSVKAGSVVGAVAADRVKRLFGRGEQDPTETA
jgi:carbon monoxide dehydrogenase subunit G